MSALKLTLNTAKTCVRDARKEAFDFLGYTFGPAFSPRTGGGYQAAVPSDKSVRRLKEKLHAVFHRGNMDPWPQVAGHANRILRGWANYFGYGTLSKAYKAVDRYVSDRVRDFLRRRHKVPGKGTARFPDRDIFGRLGVVSLSALRVARPPVSRT